MIENIHIVSTSIDFTPVKIAFREAVQRGDYVAANWLWRVEVAALMLGNYRLAEAEDAEDRNPVLREIEAYRSIARMKPSPEAPFCTCCGKRFELAHAYRVEVEQSLLRAFDDEREAHAKTREQLKKWLRESEAERIEFQTKLAESEADAARWRMSCRTMPVPKVDLDRMADLLIHKGLPGDAG